MSRLVEVASRPQTEDERAQRISAPITLRYEYGPERPNERQFKAYAAVMAEYFKRARSGMIDVKRERILLTATQASHWALEFVAAYPSDDIELHDVELGLIAEAYAAGRTPAETAKAIWALPGDPQPEDESEGDGTDE